MPTTPADPAAIVPVAIVGAGPYGLSLAAHLRARGIGFRIFGPAMKTWSHEMPPGMLLKSDGFASNLSDPAGQLPLSRYCSEQGIPYRDQELPVRLDTFIAYGLAFQQRIVPELEDRWVTSIEKDGDTFTLTFRDGGTARARRVVLAIGITHYAFVPPELEPLGPDRVIHTSRCVEPEKFRGKKVAVIGAGASALDTAAFLHDAGADVELFARSANIYIGHKPTGKPRPFWQRLRHPTSGIGASLRSRIYCDAPWLFHMLPEKLRLRIVKRHLGPASAWPVRERIEGKVQLHPSTAIKRAGQNSHGIDLTLANPDGSERTQHFDFVVPGTGYRVNLAKVPFLSDNLRTAIATVQNAPVLSQQFESSIPGLYFIGVSAANSFGPVMRFAFGSAYTARTLSRHLATQR